MKKLLRTIFGFLGYEIIKSASGVPSSGLLFKNFQNISNAYEKLFQEEHDIVLDKNPLRTLLLTHLKGTPPSEAYYLIKSLLKTKNVDGDICEFGVAQGETSALIASEILSGNKKFHIFDSFQGLSEPTQEDDLKDDIFSMGTMKSYKGSMSYQKNWVISRLESVKFPENRYFIHEGFIDDVIAKDKNLPLQVAFAYIDFDLYAPIKAALEFLNTRTCPGAILMVDDYDFFSTGVKKAVDQFVQNNPEYKIEVPSPDFGYFAILHKQ